MNTQLLIISIVFGIALFFSVLAINLIARCLRDSKGDATPNVIIACLVWAIYYYLIH